MECFLLEEVMGSHVSELPRRSSESAKKAYYDASEKFVRLRPAERPKRAKTVKTPERVATLNLMKALDNALFCSFGWNLD
eukprot:6474200-Amphidinium_carterae.1